MLPELGGWEIFEIMQEDETLKDIPVVVITVRTEGREGVWPQVQQLAGYLVKPFAIQELREVIHKALVAPSD
jgi:CheY-like chemotaxis protein